MRALTFLLAVNACHPAVQRAQTGDTAARIISLSPAATDTLVELGAGAHLVAIGRYGDLPPGRDLPRVGGLHDPNLEAIKALRPTLIVTTGAKHNGALDKLGIRVLRLAEGNLDSVLANPLILGNAVGFSEAGSALSERLKAATKPSLLESKTDTVLLVFSRQGEPVNRAWAAGPSGWLGGLMRAAGLRNVLRKGAPFVELSAEAIVALAPARIIEVHADPAQAPSPAEAQHAWAGLKPVPAVRDERISVLTGGSLLRPGPSMTDTVRRLRQLE